MKLMISQPMAGLPNALIFERRKKLIDKLTAEGHTIIDTIIKDDPDKNYNHPALYYLSKSIEYMGKVDGVVFMDGWDKSRGCVIEHRVALAYGLFIRLEVGM